MVQKGWSHDLLDQAKCRDFSRDPQGHFKNTKTISFDIIHQQASGEKVPEYLLKKVPDR